MGKLGSTSFFNERRSRSLIFWFVFFFGILEFLIYTPSLSLSLSLFFVSSSANVQSSSSLSSSPGISGSSLLTLGYRSSFSIAARSVPSFFVSPPNDLLPTLLEDPLLFLLTLRHSAFFRDVSSLCS